MASPKTVILDRLKDISKGNVEFENLMLKTYCEELAKDISRITLYNIEQDWQALYLVCHRMLPSLKIIQIIKIEEIVICIEECALELVRLETIPELIHRLKEVSDIAIKEIQDYLSSQPNNIPENNYSEKISQKKSALEILLEIIPNGCINLKSYNQEKELIVKAMEKYYNQLQ